MKYLVTVNGKQYEVTVEKGEAILSPQVIPTGSMIQAPQASMPQESTPVMTLAGPIPSDGEKVNAPMPGAILDAKVSVGQVVTKGTVLVILEAMKMENNIVAPCDGTVTFAVPKGSQVQVGDTLVVLK